MKKTKLKLTRQTVRVLANEPLASVAGGAQTGSCPGTRCCVPQSLFGSCYNTACCLEKP